MPWDPDKDIRERMKPAYGGQIPPDLETYYWEINLMIHLLDGYTYGQMSADPVHVAMDHFAGRFDAVPANEFPQAAKGQVVGHFNALRDLFHGSHPGVTMKDLYVRSFGTLNHNHIMDRFDGIQTDVGNGKIINGNGARVCMPFLEWQRKGDQGKYAPEPIMNTFLDQCGNDTLLSLINTPSWTLPRPKYIAIRNARAHGILISKRPSNGLQVLTVQFNNKLECRGGICQTADPGFCLSAEDGTCSAATG